MKKIFNFLSILLLLSNGFFSQNALSQLISQQVSVSEYRWLGIRGIDCQRQLKGRAEQVRASQYCDFLNHVASTDPHHLYDNEIGSDPYTACIERIGTPGDYRYFVLAGKCLGYKTPAEIFYHQLLHFKCEFTFPPPRE